MNNVERILITELIAAAEELILAIHGPMKLIPIAVERLIRALNNWRIYERH